MEVSRSVDEGKPKIAWGDCTSFESVIFELDSEFKDLTETWEVWRKGFAQIRLVKTGRLKALRMEVSVPFNNEILITLCATQTARF